MNNNLEVVYICHKLLVINPGSTSTKIAVYDGFEEIWAKNISHSSKDLERFENLMDQLDWRENLIKESLKEAPVQINDFSAIVARGGAGLDPVIGGTYTVDENMLRDLYEGKNAEHASNLAGIIAYNIALEKGIPAFIVDPVSVDEFESVARLSGLPELPRRCQSHALNLKAIARKTAKELNKDLADTNLIGVHLGGGISVAAIRGGRIVDVNNANQGGPYSPERAGGLPVMDLVDYIYKEKPDRKRLKKRLAGRGGLTAYLGTNDGRIIEEKIKQGDGKAKLVYDGMIYQIAKEIGAMASVFAGEVDAIFITGGLANSKYVVENLMLRINYIALVLIFPGAEEMRHLAEGVIRVLKGEEKARSYLEGRVKVDLSF